MRKSTKYSILVFLTFALLIFNICPVIAQDIRSTSDNNTLIVSITGLDIGDKATLALYPEGALVSGTSIIEQIIESKNDSTITVEIPINLKDGYYQIVLEAPDIYYRTPKGYYFAVADSQVLNPRSRPITFDLISPENRQYEPYRDDPMLIDKNTSPNTPPIPKYDDVVYRAEYMISLSAPCKQVLTLEPEFRDYSRYYADYYTQTNNQGLWGTIGVVDTGVKHDYSYDEFIADHIYASDYSQSNWMEIGWAEVSWQGNYQYLYEYDSAYDEWRLYFQVSNGTSINVALQQYSDTTWISQYYNGSYWVQMSYEDIDFSTAYNAFNGGEIVTYGSPAFPAATTTWSALRISNNWERWDTDYYTYRRYGPYYDINYTYAYYNFYVYKY